MTIKTERIMIFNNKSLGQNASLLLATPINMKKLGKNTDFYFDVSVASPGKVAVKYLLGASPGDTFFPLNASRVLATFLGGATGASRDVQSFLVSMKRMPWMKLKAIELNATRCRVNLAMIVNRE